MAWRGRILHSPLLLESDDSDQVYFDLIGKMRYNQHVSYALYSERDG